MSSPYDAVLLIAFGGPTAPQEIRPFLARVTKGIAIPPERLEEVAHHYEAVGGKSPLNEITFHQAEALRQLLNAQGRPLRVYVGMRNSRRSSSTQLSKWPAMESKMPWVLSSHRTDRSELERYQKNIADARAELDFGAPSVDYCDGWHDHPLFVQTWVELIAAAFAKIDPARRELTPLIFTAHSLPTAMAARSPYVEQLEVSARLIAERLGRRDWRLAYQSRSGKPTDPWLEPDIGATIRQLAADGHGKSWSRP